MAEDRTQIEAPLASLLPEDWTHSPESQVWLSAYRIVGLHQEDFDHTWLLDINNLRVVLLWGALPYYDVSASRIESEDESLISVRPGGEIKQTPMGAWLAFFGLYHETPAGSNEGDLKARVAESKGLLMALLGRNIAHRLLCENIINPSKGQWSGFSPVFDNPYVFPRPRINASAIELVKRAHGTIAKMDPMQRNRIALSLHWYEAGTADDGVDSFLKTWIALETLAMPDTTNISPIKELLGRAYGVPPETVSANLFVGWLCGIRGRIVHQGAVRSLHYAIPMYLEAVYKDVLFATLGIPCERFAEALTHRNDLGLETLLRSLLN